MDDTNPQERQLGSFFGLVLLRKCEELWVFGTYFSKGMRVEIDKAKHGMRIRFLMSNVGGGYGVKPLNISLESSFAPSSIPASWFACVCLMTARQVPGQPSAFKGAKLECEAGKIAA